MIPKWANEKPICKLIGTLLIKQNLTRFDSLFYSKEISNPLVYNWNCITTYFQTKFDCELITFLSSLVPNDKDVFTIQCIDLQNSCVLQSSISVSETQNRTDLHHPVCYVKGKEASSLNFNMYGWGSQHLPNLKIKYGQWWWRQP